eukprot:g4820.t1
MVHSKYSDESKLEMDLLTKNAKNFVLKLSVLMKEMAKVAEQTKTTVDEAALIAEVLHFIEHLSDPAEKESFPYRALSKNQATEALSCVDKFLHAALSDESADVGSKELAKFAKTCHKSAAEHANLRNHHQECSAAHGVAKVVADQIADFHNDSLSQSSQKRMQTPLERRRILANAKFKRMVNELFNALQSFERLLPNSEGRENVLLTVEKFDFRLREKSLQASASELGENAATSGISKIPGIDFDLHDVDLHEAKVILRPVRNFFTENFADDEKALKRAMKAIDNVISMIEDKHETLIRQMKEKDDCGKAHAWAMKSAECIRNTAVSSHDLYQKGWNVVRSANHVNILLHHHRMCKNALAATSACVESVEEVEKNAADHVAQMAKKKIETDTKAERAREEANTTAQEMEEKKKLLDFATAKVKTIKDDIKRRKISGTAQANAVMKHAEAVKEKHGDEANLLLEKVKLKATTALQMEKMSILAAAKLKRVGRRHREATAAVKNAVKVAQQAENMEKSASKKLKKAQAEMNGVDMLVEKVDEEFENGNDSDDDEFPARIFIWGRNQLYNGLGWKPENENDKPKNTEEATELLFSEAGSGIPVQVALSPTSGIAVNEHGLVLTWGKGNDGQLGHDNREDVNRPQIVSMLRKCVVTKVAMGTNHSACVTDTGSLYTWGDGSWGKLGHVDIHPRTSPEMVMGLALVKVADVQLSGKHSVCITTANEMYSWGAGSFGRLCTGMSIQVHVPKQVIIEREEEETSEGEDMGTDLHDADGDGTWSIFDVAASARKKPCYRIQNAAVSDVRTAVITTTGELYIAGRQFITESGFVEDWVKPRVISGFESPVVSVSMTDRSIAVVVANGSLFTWGENVSGMLGLGLGGKYKGDQYTPRRVEKLKDCHMVDVQLGRTFGVGLDAAGRMHSWGLDRCGKHGVGGDEQMAVLWTPTLMHALGDFAVDSVSVSGDHTAVIVKKQIMGKPPRIKTQLPKSVAVCIGMPLEIPITLLDGQPMPKATWTCDGDVVSNENVKEELRRKNVKAFDHFSDTSNETKARHLAGYHHHHEVVHNFRVEVATVAHAGTWYCRFVNKSGTVTSEPCIVTVSSLEDWAVRAKLSRDTALNDHSHALIAVKRLQNVSTIALKHAKDKADRELAAVRDAVIAAKEEMKRRITVVENATLEAEKLSMEQHRQLKFCRYTSTAVAKRGMADVTRKVALAWDRAAQAEEDVNDAKNSLAIIQSQVKDHERKVEVAIKKMEEPVNNLKHAEEVLRDCEKRLQSTNITYEKSKVAVAAANTAITKTCDIIDATFSQRIISCFEKEDGWFESPSLLLKALTRIVDVISNDDLHFKYAFEAKLDKFANRIVEFYGGGREDHVELVKTGPIGVEEKQVQVLAIKLISILDSAKKMAEAKRERNVTMLVQMLGKHHDVPSLLMRECKYLQEKVMFTAVRTLKEAELAVQVLLLAKNDKSLVGTVDATAEIVYELYAMLQWTFQHQLEHYANLLLENHFVRLSYIQESLSSELLKEWKLPEDDIERFMIAISRITKYYSPQKDKSSTLLENTIQSVLSSAHEQGMSDVEIRKLLSNAFEKNKKKN